MKRKLCPFDKSECVGELCMLFSVEKGMCSFLLTRSPDLLPGQGQAGKPVRNSESGSHERKSRFKAELFD